MSQTRALAFSLLLEALVPSLAQGQAPFISRPMTVADHVWIERQCESAKAIEVTGDAVKAALQRTRDACAVYSGSARDVSARDAWVRTMLAIQDDVGPEAMRDFVPVIGDELPESLESYSLFLIPDDRWRASEFEDKREALWEAFYSFGRSIGDDHAAIWFLDQEDNIDVQRSQEYCRLFDLSYNGGPYVVTVHKRPDLLEPSDEIVVIRMGGIGPDRVLAVLNRLSQDVRTAGDISAGALVYEELKQRLLTRVGSYQEGVRAFVGAVIGR